MISNSFLLRHADAIPEEVIQLDDRQLGTRQNSTRMNTGNSANDFTITRVPCHPCAILCGTRREKLPEVSYLKAIDSHRYHIKRISSRETAKITAAISTAPRMIFCA